MTARKRFLAFLAILITSSCAVPQTATEPALSYFDKEHWIVLRIPSSLWKVGTVIRDGEEIGNVRTESCLPEQGWPVDWGEVAKINEIVSKYRALTFSGKIKLDVFGLSDEIVVSAGLGPRTSGDLSDNKVPAYKSVVNIKKASESRVNLVEFKAWLTEEDATGRTNFSKLNRECRKTLLDSKVQVVTKIFALKEAEFEIIDRSGAFIDLRLPTNEVLREAVLKAKYADERNGKIVIAVPPDSPPITLAVRVFPQLSTVMEDVVSAMGLQGGGAGGLTDQEAQDKVRDQMRQKGSAL